jgi:Undecaprenyl-phosphate galactose phosphotransferase WbaP
MHKRPDIRLASIRLLSVALDLLTIAAAFAILTLIRKALGGEFELGLYSRLWPFLIIFWLVFEKIGLYNGTSIHSGASIGPVEEIRRIFYATTTVFIALGFSNYCYRPGNYLYSRSILIGTFLLVIIFLPINRILLRKILTRLNLWGVPAILIGSGKTACRVFQSMQRGSEYGLIPVGFFTDSDPHQMPDDAVYLGKIDEIHEKTASMGVKYAILAKDNSPDAPLVQQIISRYGARFPHLLIVPPFLLNTSSGVLPKDIGGTLGLEIRHNLQIPSLYRIKRIIDYAFTLPILVLALPLMGLIALWIKLDSPGPAFFKHQRITKNGRQINIYKFRTMTNNATEKLNDLLNSSPELNHEWEQYGKLEHDPRISRAGAWLRKTSLDELPQLFNVLQGNLTLVGPRPLVQDELAIYGEAASLFDQVLPGLTGLWQVSGRNELTYEDRARLDLYYVNNWSVWLDIYILSKSVYTVLFRHGAK